MNSARLVLEATMTKGEAELPYGDELFRPLCRCGPSVVGDVVETEVHRATV